MTPWSVRSMESSAACRQSVSKMFRAPSAAVRELRPPLLVLTPPRFAVRTPRLQDYSGSWEDKPNSRGRPGRHTSPVPTRAAPTETTAGRGASRLIVAAQLADPNIAKADLRVVVLQRERLLRGVRCIGAHRAVRHASGDLLVVMHQDAVV